MSKQEYDLTRVVWRTASYTNGNGACVEVANLDGRCWMVRDSKDPAGPVLTVSPGEWTAFVAGVRTSDFG